MKFVSVTNSAEGPLVDLLPPSRTTLLRNRDHSYVLPEIRTKRFKCCFSCNPERLFLKSMKSLFIYSFNSGVRLSKTCFVRII